MRKSYLMKSMALVAIAATAASCNHDAWNERPDTTKQQTQEYANNFRSIVLGGQNMDPRQTWNTATSSTVKVSVNLNYNEDYTLYITESNPLTNKQSAYLAKAVITSGNTKTLTITRPSAVVGYFAALYDKNNHAIVKPFSMESGETIISFGEASSSAPQQNRAASTGNRWSVTTLSMPSLTSYTTGTLYEMEEAFNTNGSTVVNQADGSEKHLKITGNYSGGITRIQSYDNQSVYVTGTWEVPADQRCTGGSVIVVGDGGVINIPANHKLSTNANNNAGTTGMIYVMPGGKITGDGELQFSNGTETYSYNAGVITVKDININGGTFYNAGKIGGVEGENNPALTGPAGTIDSPSKFINMGKATLASIGGAGISVENACNLTVVGLMELGKSSKMDNGSYTECGSLKLAGSNNGDCTLYMGQAAYLKNKGDFNVNNYGVWGPTSGNRAIFELSNEVSYANMSQNLPGTQLLDNVELIIPEDFPAEITNNGYSTNFAGAVIYAWFNGLNYRTINPGAFKWDSATNSLVPDETTWPYTNNANVTDDRRTCLLGTSPSYTVEADEDGCGTGFSSGGNIRPSSPSWCYFAFEDLGKSDDFDFNDIVVRVSTPDENGLATVELCAIGGTLECTVFNGTAQIGQEVHSYGVFGANTSNWVGVPIAQLDKVNVPEGTTVAQLNINIQVKRSDGSIVTVTGPAPGETPFRVCVMGDEQGRWYWAKERVNISSAYPKFGAWGANIETYPEWYKEPVAASVMQWQDAE